MLPEVSYETLAGCQAAPRFRELVAQGERGVLLRQVPSSLLSSNLLSSKAIESNIETTEPLIHSLDTLAGQVFDNLESCFERPLELRLKHHGLSSQHELRHLQSAHGLTQEERSSLILVVSVDDPETIAVLFGSALAGMSGGLIEKTPSVRLKFISVMGNDRGPIALDDDFLVYYIRPSDEPSLGFL